jgi:hypothetical protein
VVWCGVVWCGVVGWAGRDCAVLCCCAVQHSTADGMD